VLDDQNIHNQIIAIHMPVDGRSESKGVLLKILNSWREWPTGYLHSGGHFLENSLSNFMQLVRK
jgi:hypothetical protein